MSSDLTELPAMRSLNERQRKFVLEMAVNPFGNHADWARAAGYPDTNGTARVTAYRLFHDPKIQAAAQEVARATASTLGVSLAMAGWIRIAKDPDHKDHAKALEALADRGGLQKTQHVHVTHTDMTGDALIEQIRQLALKHGLDEQKLIGANAIEGEFEVVTGIQGQSVGGPGAAKSSEPVQEGRDVADGEGPGSD